MKSYSVLMAGLITFLATGCVQWKGPICAPNQLADFPNLEGKYELRMYDMEKFSIMRESTEITHSGAGSYAISGDSVQGCFVNGRYFLQSLDDHGNYEISEVRNLPQGGGITISVLGVGNDTLSQNGISFEVVNQPESLKSRISQALKKMLDHQNLVVVIDNRNKDFSTILPIMDSLSVDMVLWKTN